MYTYQSDIPIYKGIILVYIPIHANVVPLYQAQIRDVNVNSFIMDEGAQVKTTFLTVEGQFIPSKLN